MCHFHFTSLTLNIKEPHKAAPWHWSCHHIDRTPWHCDYWFQTCYVQVWKTSLFLSTFVIYFSFSCIIQNWKTFNPLINTEKTFYVIMIFWMWLEFIEVVSTIRPSTIRKKAKMFTTYEWAHKLNAMYCSTWPHLTIEKNKQILYTQYPWRPEIF